MPSAPTPFQPRGVIDQGLAAAADGGHEGVPAGAQRAGHGRH